MSAQSISPAFTTFQDIDGQPLESGYIYIGTAGLAAATNQITVYWDAALSSAVTQPIRTTGGYPMNSGAPGVIYTGADDYSLAVNNKNNSTIYSSLNILKGYQSSSAGATSRTVPSKLGDIVSVKDFGAVGDGFTDDSAAIIAAIASLGSTGGEIYFPQSTYYCNATITITTQNVTLAGAGCGMAYEGGSAGTKIVFGALTEGINITATNSYACIRDMQLNGNGNCQYPLKVQGTVLLEGLNVTGSTAAGAGIWLFELINQTRLQNVSSCYNSGIGVLIGTGGATLNTVCSFDHVTIRSNLIGLKVHQVRNLKVSNTVLESNTQEGLIIYKDDGKENNYHIYDNVWLENNYAGTSNYNMVIDSETQDLASGASYLEFRNCNVGATGTTKVMNLLSVRFCNFTNLFATASADIDLAAYASYVSFNNNEGGTINDSGNRNYEINSDRTLSGGLISSKPLLQPTPSSYYVWAGWNPTLVDGTIENGSATASVSSINTVFCSASNTTGTLQVVFTIAGTYKIDIMVSVTSVAAYTYALALLNLGGTATRATAQTVYSSAGESDSDSNFQMPISFLVRATNGQTLTMLPQNGVSSGNAASNYVYTSEANWTYLGT